MHDNFNQCCDLHESEKSIPQIGKQKKFLSYSKSLSKVLLNKMTKVPTLHFALLSRCLQEVTLMPTRALEAFLMVWRALFHLALRHLKHKEEKLFTKG